MMGDRKTYLLLAGCMVVFVLACSEQESQGDTDGGGDTMDDTADTGATDSDRVLEDAGPDSEEPGCEPMMWPRKLL